MYTGLLRGMWFQSHVAHYKAVISLVDRTLDFQSRDKSLILLRSLAYIIGKDCFVSFLCLFLRAVLNICLNRPNEKLDR